MQEEKSMDYEKIYWGLKITNYYRSIIEIDGVEYVPLNNVRPITAMSEEALEEQVNTTPQAKLSNENYAYISDIIEFDNECISDALYNRALSKYQKKSKLTIEEAEILYQNGDLKVEDIIDNDKKTDL